MADLKGILDRLEQLLGPAAGAPTPLDGGITNRNYRVTLGGEEYVVRLPGKDTNLLGISREAERVATEAAAALGIAPAVAATLDECLVTSFIACGPVTAEGLADGVEEIAAALRAFHDCGVQLPVRFWVPELLDSYASIAHQRGCALPEAYAEAVVIAARIAAALPASGRAPCHNDLLSGNVIRAQADARMLIVDWEYAGMGDRLFDLGNLSINNDFDERADDLLLEAYFDEPPADGRRAALGLMRCMSDAREAAWGVVQGAVSELDFDFNSYSEEHFDRLRAAAADPRFAEWLGAAAA
jgi:thiamine kinase-like enzyme